MGENTLCLVTVSPLTQNAYHDCPVCMLAITSADGDCVSVELNEWPALQVHVRPNHWRTRLTGSVSC